MSLAVRCKNIVRFDPQQGQYVRCEHEFQVGDDAAGSSVRCPKCGQAVTAPERSANGREAPPPTPSTVRTPQRTTSEPPRPAVKPGPPPKPDLPAPPSQTLPSPGPSSLVPPASDDDYPEVLDDDDEFRLAPIELPKLDFSQAGLPSAEKSPALPPAAPTSTRPASPKPSAGGLKTEQTADETAPCPGCSRPLMVRSVICPACGYHKGLARRVDAFEDSDEERKKAVGFERWLRGHLAEGDDPGAVRSVLIVAALLCLGLGAMMYMIIGHAIWVFVAIAGLLAAGKWLGWWKLDFWKWLLFVQRMAQWRTPVPPFAPRKLLDLRNMQLSDEELGNLKNLADFEVLDLEGTPITDLGLPSLYDYANLKYIVLRDTQATEQGVANLQRALPTASIWR